MVYCVWQGLRQTKHITKHDVQAELENGSLPEYFQSRVRKQVSDYEKAKQYYMGRYIPELLLRGFDGISWDLELHQLCRVVSLPRQFDDRHVHKKVCSPQVRV